MHLFKLQKIPNAVQEYKLSTNVIDFLSNLAETVGWVVRFTSGPNDDVLLQLDQNIPEQVDGYPLLKEIEEYIWKFSGADWLDWVLTVPMRKIVHRQYDIPLIYVQRTLPWLAGQFLAKEQFRLTEQGLFTRAELPGDVYMLWEKIASRMAYLYSNNALYEVSPEFAEAWKLQQDPVQPLWYPQWGDICILTFGIQQNYGSLVDFLMTRQTDKVYWYGEILRGISNREDLIREVRKLL